MPSPESLKRSPTSEKLDAHIRHIESQQFHEYLEEYNRQSLKREGEQKQTKTAGDQKQQSASDEIVLQASKIEQKPRQEINLTYPQFLHSNHLARKQVQSQERQRHVTTSQAMPFNGEQFNESETPNYIS